MSEPLAAEADVFRIGGFRGPRIQVKTNHSSDEKGDLMKKKTFGVLVVALLLVSFVPRASGDHGGRIGFAPPPPSPGRAPEAPPWGPAAEGVGEGLPGAFWPGCFEVLGLDEKQQARVRAIERRVAKDEIPKGAALEVTRIELQEILGK
jgi:hypothetical protein